MILRRASRIYFRLNRVAMFSSRIQGLMVLYLFCESLEISFWLMLLGAVPLIYLVHYLGKHYILPEELDMIFNNQERKHEKAA